jgi:hypothetical protein
MDILKNASAYLKSCQVSQNEVKIDNKIYKSDTAINFPSAKSKSYTLGSVVFYLINQNMPITEYVTKCQSMNILPVSYIDQTSIKEDISNYTISLPSGHFIEPIYTYMRKYEIFEPKDCAIILVSNDLLSSININNIEHVLDTGAVVPKAFLPFSKASKGYEKGSYKFNIYNDASLIKEHEWMNVKAVFLDDSTYYAEGLEDNLAKIARKSAFFSFSDKEIKCTKLHLENGKIKNFEEMWNKIKEAVNK